MKIRLSFLCLLVLALSPLSAQEPARPLTERGLENLVAFTRLLGYVRHFHPSDQAAAADWDGLALAGVKAVEGAAGPTELARALEEVFRPVAPTVVVFPTGPRPRSLPSALSKPKEPLEVVAWEHRGYTGFMPDRTFKSERVARPTADPGKPFQADLGGGVSALVPLTLYRDAQGTLPHETVGSAPKAPEKTSGNDRATRLAGVALAWNVLQHFYPYFDVVRSDWPAVLRRTLTAAATDPDERAFLDTLRRMVAALQDSHGVVMHRSDPWTGQLPLLWEWIEDRLVVTHVAPKDAEGIQRGDVVLRINGRPAGEVVAAREELTSGATPGYRRYAAVFTLGLGMKDQEVQLEVRHPTGETATVVVRHSMQFPASVTEARPEKIAELKPGLFYVDLTRILDDDFKGALDRLSQAKGIVFDLRGHPSGVSPVVLGHLTDQPLDLGASSVPVITRPDRQGMKFEPVEGQSAQPASPRLRAKVAFITDARAVSYAENYLIPVEQHRLGEIVGSPTAGTTGNFAPFRIPGGYQIFWTALRVNKPDGSPFHGVGIKPTVPVSRTLKGVVEGRDEVLDKAVEVVGR
jgi:C-terminal processing protease CtpA/Prc